MSVTWHVNREVSAWVLFTNSTGPVKPIVPGVSVTTKSHQYDSTKFTSLTLQKRVKLLPTTITLGPVTVTSRGGAAERTDRQTETTRVREREREREGGREGGRKRKSREAKQLPQLMHYQQAYVHVYHS